MEGDKLIIQDHHVRAARAVREILEDEELSWDSLSVFTIAGESGSGKSEIASVLKDLFEERNVLTLILQQDDYFHYPPKTNARMREKNIGRVGTSEVRLDLLDENIRTVRGGAHALRKPLVIFEEDRIEEEVADLNGVQAIIVEGTYTTLLKEADVRIFIDRTNEDTRKARELRAREEQDPFLEKILLIEHEIISSHKRKAHIVIDRDYGAAKRREWQHD